MKYPKNKLTVFVQFAEYDCRQVNVHRGKKWNYWFIEPNESVIKLSKGILPNELVDKNIGELGFVLRERKIELFNITEEQVKHICNLVNEPFINFQVNDDGKWDEVGLEIQINTTSTIKGHRDDSYIWIQKDGTIQLWRNNGGWGGSRYENINSLIITDYLRGCGYAFATKN